MTPHWLTDEEMKMIRPIANALAIDVNYNWYASDETFSAYFGPFSSRAEASAWQRSYAESL